MTVVEREVTPEVLTEREQRARTLEAAALEIEVRGWATGMGRDGEGRVCLLGAIALVLGMEPASWPDCQVSAAFGVNHDEDDIYPEDWNDAPGRTADEVTFLLRWRAEEIRDGF